MSTKQKIQQRMEEKELLARAQVLSSTAKPIGGTVKVNYTHKGSTLNITLPKHLGGLKTTATISGKFSYLFRFGKDPDIASVSLVESEEKISSIPFVFKGTKVETGDIFHSPDDFDKEFTHGTANFNTGEFKMTYLVSPRVPFLSKYAIPLPGQKGQIVNEERGVINPKTFNFKLEGKIFIESGPFAKTLITIREDPFGDDEEHVPSCHIGAVHLLTVNNGGEYIGQEQRSGPICGHGIRNDSEYLSIFVQHGGKSLTLGPKEQSSALNGMDIHGFWYVLMFSDGVPCETFDRFTAITVFYEF
jgi:hypothetical protein